MLDWMKKAGIRREELAVRLGVSTGTILNILSGRRPSRHIVITLAHVMGCPEADLLPYHRATKTRPSHREYPGKGAMRQTEAFEKDEAV